MSTCDDSCYDEICGFENDAAAPRKTTEELRSEGWVEYGDISLSAFYMALENMDPFSCFSDDREVYWKGEGHKESLDLAALKNGRAHAWLMSEYGRHLASGEPWKTPKHPRPVLLDNPTVNELIDLRADYERLAFTPSRVPGLEALQDRARCMGALGDGIIPKLVASVECLRAAWVAGESDADDAYDRLARRFENKHGPISPA